MSKPRTTLPWVYVGNGAVGFSGPLPADPAAFAALLEKFSK